MKKLSHLVVALACCLPVPAISQGVEEPPGVEQPAMEPPFSPAEASDEVRRVADVAVSVFFPETFPSSAMEEAEELRLRVAHALTVAIGAPYFATLNKDEDVVEIYYNGQVEFSPYDEVDEEGDEGVPLERLRLPRKYSDGANWYTGVSGETGNEFEVRVPERLVRLVGRYSLRNGFMFGTPGGEEEPDLPKGDNQDQQEQGWHPIDLLAPRAFAGIVGTDDRILKGQTDTRQASANLSKIISFVPAGANDGANSQCTGALFGRHHVLTAGHCIYRRRRPPNPAAGQPGVTPGWNQWEHRVGRNGSDWHAAADSTTGWRWYWASSLYLAAARSSPTGGSPKEYDIGMVIFPDRHIGSGTGWFGYWYSQQESDDMLNRGFPHCSPSSGAPPPDMCDPGHMYGDENDCSTRGFSSLKDSAGYSLVGYHSCDTSRSQSGSPVYRFQNEEHGWVLRGAHKGATDSGGWQSFALITSQRADMMAFFKLVYP